MTTDNVLLEYPKLRNPFVQGGVVFAGASAAMVTGLGLPVDEVKFPYMCAAAFLFLFSIFSSIISFAGGEPNRYLSLSISAYMLLLAGMLLAAWLFSGTPVHQAGSYLWILMVLTFAHFMLLTITFAIRWIADFFRRRDEFSAGK